MYVNLFLEYIKEMNKNGSLHFFASKASGVEIGKNWNAWASRTMATCFKMRKEAVLKTHATLLLELETGSATWAAALQTW
jgi:hypothetical protein